MIERRKLPRRRVYFGGQMEFSNSTTMECVVSSFHSAGARIKCSHHVTMPDRFDLFIVKHQQIYRSRMAWRTQDEIGLSFLTKENPANEIAFDEARH
jgi:hypothetical protein